MMARPFGLGPVFKTLCLLAMVTGASLSFAQSPAPAKLVVKNGFILTMAKDQREPVKGYMVVG
jgi:hypothetical protein